MIVDAKEIFCIWWNIFGVVQVYFKVMEADQIVKVYVYSE